MKSFNSDMGRALRTTLEQIVGEDLKKPVSWSAMMADKPDFTTGNPPRFDQIEPGMLFRFESDERSWEISDLRNKAWYFTKSDMHIVLDTYGYWTFLGYAPARREDNVVSIEAKDTADAAQAKMLEKYMNHPKPYPGKGTFSNIMAEMRKSMDDTLDQAISAATLGNPIADDLLEHVGEKWVCQFGTKRTGCVLKEYRQNDGTSLVEAHPINGNIPFSLNRGMMIRKIDEPQRDEGLGLEEGLEGPIVFTPQSEDLDAIADSEGARTFKPAPDCKVTISVDKCKHIDGCDRPRMPARGVCSIHQEELVTEMTDDFNEEFAKKQAENKKAWSRKLIEEQAGQFLSGRSAMVGDIHDWRNK